jgi:polygalacturonase
MIRSLFITCLLLFYNGLLFTQDFNILDFGAAPDGKTLNTFAIQSAVDAAHKNGGGRVLIPEGRFLSGSIVLKSGVELHLLENAVLLGSTIPDHYVKLNRWKAFIIADNQENIGITGTGEIDGQGRQLALHIDSLFYAGEIDSSDYNFVEMRPKYYLRPQLIEFVDCKDIKVRDVTLRNAACWVQTHHQCENIVIDGVQTISDAYWNNDGIDIQDCQNVRITNCFVNSADDGICIKSHSSDHLSKNIYIGNCTVRSSASAIKFGTRSHGGFQDVVIENIRVYDTYRSAIAIECVDGGILENVLVQNVQAENIGNAIFIRLGKRHTERAGALRNVTLKNIQVEVAYERPDYAYEVRGPALPFFHNTFPASITGIPGHAIENVVLENIAITYPGKGNDGLAHMPISRLKAVPEKEADYPEFSMFGELPSWGFYVRHLDGLTMKNVYLKIKEPDYRPAFVFDDVRNLRMQSISINGDDKTDQVILHQTENVIVDEHLRIKKME